MPADSQIALSGVHKTAFMAATLRAGHYLHADEPKRFEDSCAHRLLEMTEDEIRAFNAKIPGRLLSTCPLRSRFAEDRPAPSPEPRNIVDYTSYISMQEITDMLGKAGFSRVEPLTREAADAFFKGRTDGLATPRFNRALAAVV